MITIDTPDSSNIERLTYCHRSEQLAVCYRTTGWYVYADVSPLTFDDLKSASSIGSFVARKIKPLHACSGRVKPFTHIN